MKILIIGTVGTGKTTLASELSREYNIKHYEIDSIVHDDENGGKKRTEKEQNVIIESINKNKDWIIEGTLRKNLEYLLNLADRIIYLNIPRQKRNRRIIKRFIKQKLGMEKVNYKPTIRMLKMMLKWSNEYENKKEEFECLLDNYKEKLEKRN